MGRQWHEGAAAELVNALVEQRVQRAEAEARQRNLEQQAAKRKKVSLGVGVTFLLLAVAAIPVVFQTEPGSQVNLVALFGAPMLAGVFGAIARTSLDEGTDWVASALLGLGAGALAALLFVASQLATSNQALEEPGVKTLVVFMAIVGAIGGLTFDAVYKKLRQEDVADVTGLKRR